jgi:hypothetical protein
MGLTHLVVQALSGQRYRSASSDAFASSKEHACSSHTAIPKKMLARVLRRHHQCAPFRLLATPNGGFRTKLSNRLHDFSRPIHPQTERSVSCVAFTFHVSPC